jgi:hypothetical protein
MKLSLIKASCFFGDKTEKKEAESFILVSRRLARPINVLQDKEVPRQEILDYVPFAEKETFKIIS